jgi:hypothetical protein
MMIVLLHEGNENEIEHGKVEFPLCLAYFRGLLSGTAAVPRIRRLRGKSSTFTI